MRKRTIVTRQPKEVWTSKIGGKRKIEIVDRIYAELAKMYNVPKPDYGIYRIVTVRSPDTENDYWRVFPYLFHPEGENSLIVLKDRAIMSKTVLLHEFGHYLAYVRNGYEPLGREKSEMKAVNFSKNRRVRRLVNRIIYEMNNPDKTIRS